MIAFSNLTRLPRLAKTLILVLVDSLIGATAFWLAVLVRSGRIPTLSWDYIAATTMFVMALVPAVGLSSGLYRPVVRFQIPRLSARAGMVSGITGSLVSAVGFYGGASYQHSIGLGAAFALILFVLIIWSRHEARLLLGASNAGAVPVAVYGAGDAGRQLVGILRRGQDRLPVLFIDDDTSIHGRTIEDLLVVSPHSNNFGKRLQSRGVKEVLLAIPSVSIGRRREILEFLGGLQLHVRSVPGSSKLANADGRALAHLKEVSIEELLGRDSVSPLAGLLEKCVKDKVVLVTGGGGSIGSELCRQVLALHPKQLIILDHSEYALYEIEQELRGNSAERSLPAQIDFVLSSLTNSSAVTALLEANRVDTIYHAAAYKHVPIVEHNPVEGFRNNVLATWYLARSAGLTGVKTFVLISSDKAVRPTNVMGATKRMAELVIQTQANLQPGTIFSMVRFGNVMGSSGSAIPLFRRQIEIGGPVTLTHPDITRYFMTTQEAVELVIQAGAMASGGEVFVLDMGGPVKIIDLVRKMIALSGRSVRDISNPLGDISIEVIGMRPGEKLYEELLISGEAIGTAHPRIWKVREDSVDSLQFEGMLSDLENAIRNNPSRLDIRQVLARWVSGYAQACDRLGLASVRNSLHFSN